MDSSPVPSIAGGHSRCSGERTRVFLQGGDVVGERDANDLDVAVAPELLLDGVELGWRPPSSDSDRPLPPEPVEDHPRAPVTRAVAEEEEVAAAQACGQTDGNGAHDLGAGEVADVVVLGHDEALVLAARASGRPARGA